MSHSAAFHGIVRGRARRNRHIHRAADRRRSLCRPLRLEALEDRRLLAITVNTLLDEADGSIVDGDVSLRDAIALAPSGETISFSITGTIDLTLGHLTINKNLTIVGPGAGLLAIDQNTVGSRVLNVDDGNSINDKSISISGLTITGGNQSGNNPGGGIRSRENLTLTTSTITGNTAADSSGGGIWQSGGTLAISTSTISGNTARSGGGLFLSSVNATIEGSTISGSTASSLSGGGVALGLSTLTMSNSTISGNTAYAHGGGIYLSNSTLTARHSTVTANRGDADNSGSDLGGGIAVTTYSSATLDHAIVAGNFGPTGTRDDVGVDLTVGPVLASHSLIGDKSGTLLVEAPVGLPDANGNLVGGPVHGAIDPLLGALVANGGSTATHALLAGSPASDMGDAAIAFPPASDQRGAPHVRIADGDGVAGARIDIGSFERQLFSASYFVVDTLSDQDDGDYSPGNRSLRGAIRLANINVGADVITFAPALSGQMIQLNLTELVITEAVTIDATALGEKITIRPSDSRIFSITSATGDFTFAGLHLTNGQRFVSADSTTGGGAIRSLTSGSLTLTQSIVSASTTGFLGGGFANGGGIYALGDVTLNQSTVSGNSTVGDNSSGGGIYAYGDVTLNQSTVSGNSTNGSNSDGSGIFTRGSLTLSQSTVSGNSTMGGNSDGGGIYAVGDVTLNQSTVSGNMSRLGGGIFARGDVALTQTTVSGNSSLSNGGGIFAVRGVSLAMSTVTYNHASSSGGGVSQSPSDYNFSFSINGSILAGNSAGVGGAVLVKDPQSTLTVNYSLIDVANGLTFAGNIGNLTGTTADPLDPELAPLADNGGPTMTHALLLDSPAINAGDPTAVAGVGVVPLYDQRGAPDTRVHGARIDMGAFEFQPTAASADFDNDDDVDGVDFLAWQSGFGTPAPTALKFQGDADNDKDVDGNDLAVWHMQFGSAPPVVAASESAQASALTAPATPADDSTIPRLILTSELVDAAMATTFAARPAASERVAPWAESLRHRRPTVARPAALVPVLAASSATSPQRLRVADAAGSDGRGDDSRAEISAERPSPPDLGESV